MAPSAARYRWWMTSGEALLALAAVGGSLQLVTGTFAPPAADLPFGWKDWVLPGIWLFATVAVPSAVAALLCVRRSRRAPAAVLVASGLLLLELLVQLPFLGVSPLFVACGLVGLTLAGAALRFRRRS